MGVIVGLAAEVVVVLVGVVIGIVVLVVELDVPLTATHRARMSSSPSPLYKEASQPPDASHGLYRRRFASVKAKSSSMLAHVTSK